MRHSRSRERSPLIIEQGSSAAPFRLAQLPEGRGRSNGEELAFCLPGRCRQITQQDAHDFGKSYGMDGRKKLVRRIAEEIRNCFGTRAVIGRMGVNRFIILQNREEEGMIEKELDALSGKLQAIHSVDGCPCTLFLRTARVDCTETEDVDEMKTLLLRRLSGNEA